ncbi:hypothetical protein M514_07219 [Trichuris suis]|uniref:DDE-1 domain-containing protein n=1 Tax=Trichuris suis TaxID=68888 RepID=A0A085NC42_9BILA|nr:hypothetical protein M514_07219 [Trichuris suis]
MRASKNEEVMEAAYGEKLSADTLSADNFTGELKELLEREHYDEDFVYSADETGLNWRALPTRTLATHAESTVPGFKAAKDRVTLMVCANSTGTHRLPLFLIGKSKRPGAIGRAKKLLAVYSHQKRAWMNTETFTYWLKNVFVPEVRGFQNSIRRSGKVLLLIDNAPAHAASAQLNSLHEDVTVHFLPPNVTPIQLMHQGVIRSLKVHYRRRLLEQLLCSDNFAAKSAPDFYKMADLRDCCYLAAESWEAIKQSTRLEIKDLRNLLRVIPHLSEAIARSACFVVCTTLSTSPLDDGWYGATLRNLIRFAVQNCLKLPESKAVPLSETRTSGSPWVANKRARCRITSLDSVEATCSTSSHFECESTMSRYVLPRNGPAKSMWIRDQGLGVQFHTRGGAFGGLPLYCWQSEHSATRRSIVSSIPGHQT